MSRALILLALLLASPAPAQDRDALIAAARAQVGVTTIYDPAYVALAFPGGDLPRDRGVCTDVIIRAFRDAWGIDLQRAVNRDMRRAFAAYPALWGLSRTDRSIDHRRVPNLETFLTRAGAALGPGAETLPGDLVTVRLPGNLPHVMIVSDRRSADGGRPLALHNIGNGVREEDALDRYPRVAHFRVTPAVADRLRALDAP